MATTKRTGPVGKTTRRNVAAHTAASARNPANLQPRAIAFAVATAFMPLAAYGQTTATTLPTGFTNVVGGASVTVSGSTMNVNSASNTEINNFQTFSIGSAATVNFNQLGAGSVSLNRVVGNNPSEIFGRLNANGQVFLVNNSGILFAPGASVSAAGLFASTLSIADQDFVAGRYQFFNPGNAGAVINQGNIITANGFTALAGPQVRNDGVIIARSGSVALAAGDRVSLDIIGDGLISVSVDQAALNAAAINTGRIEADGGAVLLTARSANALLDTVINNSGVIRANSLVERNGEIVLDGGSTGVVSVTGTLEAAGTTAGTTGGTIKVLGDKVGLFDGAHLNASGDAGGGTVLVGGNWQGKGPERNASATVMESGASISADAVTAGDGGTVVVWSNDSTRVHGTISARGGALSGNGGNVETSGHYLDIAGARVDTRAPNGKGGNWLLDPLDVTIVDDVANTSANGSFNLGDPNIWTPDGNGTSVVSDQDINDNLANTSVTIMTGANGTDPGDILVQQNVSIVIPTNRTLTLDAFRNIDIQDNASVAGADATSVLDLRIGQGGAGGTLFVSANATLPDPATGTINVTGHNGTDAIVVERDANMTLSDSSLVVDGNYTLNLASVEVANLTGGASDNTFDVSNWTGSGALDGLGGSDSVVKSKDTNFTLSDSALTSADSMNLSLANIEVGNLTGGTGNNTFTVSNWTGNATLGGGAGDDVFNVTLSASGTVVAGAAGDNDTLNVIGNGTINVNATAVENGQVVTYAAAMENVNVLGQGGSDTIAVTATSGNASYSIDGGAGTNTIVVSADANFTLADALLQVNDSVDFAQTNISLANVTVANLTGGGSDNTFDVSNWTGAGALDGLAGSDSILKSKDTNFTLSDSALTSADSMNLSLANIEVANLTGDVGNNTFTVSSWTGNATLGGGAGDDVFNVTLSASGTVVAGAAGGNDTLNVSGSGAINVNATAVENGQVVTYAAAMENVNVLGQGGSDTITVTATSGNASYSINGGAGTNTIVVSADANFTLSNALLQVVGGAGFDQGNISLANVTVANLTGGGSDNIFTVSGWTGSGALAGAGGTGDRIVETDDFNFTLTDALLARTGQGTLTLTGIEVANLTGGAADNSFTVSGWTGAVTLDGAGGTGDRVVASNDVNFTLSNNTLARSGFANNVTLASIEVATLTGGVGTNIFDVSGWTGLGSLNGGGAGADAVVASKDTDFTLSNLRLVTSDGMNMSLTLIGTANLTGGPSNNTFNVNSFLSVANVVGGDGADTFNMNMTGTTSSYNVDGGLGIDTVNVLGTGSSGNFTISATTVVSGGDTVTYSNAEAVTISGLVGGDTFTFSGANPGVNYTVHGNAGIDTLNIDALNQNITLTGGGNGTISGGVGSFTTMENLVGADTLIGGQNWTITGANAGTVDAFTFSLTGNLVGTAGNDTFTMSGGSLTLGGASITGAGGTDTLATTVGHTFNITGTNSGTLSGVTGNWTGISNLVGGAGGDTFNGQGGSVATITDSGGTTTLNGTVQTSGNQTYSGPATLGSSTSVNSSGGAVGFGSTVNGGFDLTANATTSATFGGAVSTASLTVTAPAISLAGVTTTGAQTYNGTTVSVANTFTTNGGAFTVNGNTVAIADTVVDSGAGAAAFNGTINGPGGLTVNGSGVNFAGAIGVTSALAGLTVNAPMLFGGGVGTVNATGNVNLTGIVQSPGAITFSTGGGSFNANNASNDFVGQVSVVSGGGNITIFDADTLLVNQINAGFGGGFVTLNAVNIQEGNPNSLVTGGGGSFTTGFDVLDLGLSMPQTGSLTLISPTPSTPMLYDFDSASAGERPAITVNGDIAVAYNGIISISNSVFDQGASAGQSASQSIGAIIVEEANKTFGTDSVAEDVEYGFAGEIGATPPMDHRIDESGISLPRCVQEAREGLPCK